MATGVDIRARSEEEKREEEAGNSTGVYAGTRGRVLLARSFGWLAGWLGVTETRLY